MGRPMISRGWILACLTILAFVATLCTNKATMRNLVQTTRISTSYLNQFETIHHDAPTLDVLQPVFESCRIFDLPEDEISELGVLDWPEVYGTLVTDRNNFAWTESVQAGVIVTRYISKGTVRLTMRNEISSSERFMGAGSLVDIAGPVTLTWTPKHDDEQVVIRAPTRNEPDRFLVVTGAFTVLSGVLLAHRLSFAS